MKYFADCIPCHFSQAQRIARELSLSPQQKTEFFIGLCASFAQLPKDLAPVEVAEYLYSVVEKQFHTRDVFREKKILSNQVAMAVLKEFQKEGTFDDQLLRFFAKLASRSNIIDLGAHEVEIHQMKEDLLAGLEEDFAIDHFDQFASDLQSARSLLVLLDNAGEMVFDGWLIQQIQRRYPRIQVTAVVRSQPIINDGTMEDAKQVGMDAYCAVIPSGSTLPGTVLSQCTPEFQEIFARSDLVISKGQGNFEGLCAVSRPELFFSLTAKCAPVAEYIGISKGGSVWISSIACSEPESPKG